jgi:hypothetical protein
MRLKVLNKVSWGYELGYLVNPCQCGTYSSAGIIKSDLSLVENDNVAVKTDCIEPIYSDSHWSLKFGPITILEKTVGKVMCTAEIIKEAKTINILKISDDCTILQDLKINPKLGEEIIWKRDCSILKATKEQHPNHVFYCVVYSPNEVDAHGDYASAEEVQKAAWGFMRTGNISLMHEKLINNDAEVVESSIIFADTKIGSDIVKAGDWLAGIHVPNDEIWNKIESGEYNSVSMEGKGREGPDVKKSFSGILTKRNLIDMAINAIAIVDKGAARKRICFKKSEKGINMNKELAMLLLKMSKDTEVRTLVLKQLSEDDKIEVEKAFPAKTPEELAAEQAAADAAKKKPPVVKELDPAMLDQIVTAVMAKLKADADAKVSAEWDKEKKVKKFLEDSKTNLNLEIPEDIYAEVLKAS